MECAATSMCLPTLISDIDVAVTNNFTLLVLSTWDLFACFCTHPVLERSMGHTRKPTPLFINSFRLYNVFQTLE